MAPLKRFLYTTLTLLLLGAFALGPTTSKAQNEAGSVYLGAQGGLASASLTGDNADGSSLSGFTGGVHLLYNVNEFFSVQFGVGYTRRGAADFSAESSDAARVSEAWNLDGVEYRFEYVDVPVLLKLTAPIEGVNIRGFAGPSLNFRFDSTVDGDGTIRRLQSNVAVNRRNLFFDLAGVLGVEIGVPLPGVRGGEVFVDGRYEHGFFDLGEVDGFEYKNRSFGGTLGVRFALGN